MFEPWEETDAYQCTTSEDASQPRVPWACKLPGLVHMRADTEGVLMFFPVEALFLQTETAADKSAVFRH